MYMVTMANDSGELMALVETFERMTNAVNRDQWALRDIAAKIYEAYGPAGLSVLAEHSTYAYSTLQRWAMLAKAVKPALRRQFADVSPEVFRVALATSRKFSSHSPKGRLSYWLKVAQDQHLNSTELQREANQVILMIQLSSHSAEQTRQEEVTHRIQTAQQHLRQIEEAIARFNRQDAPYALFTVSLTRTAFPAAH